MTVLRLLPAALLLLTASWAPAQADAPAAHGHAHEGDRARATHRFEDAQKWSGIWDHPSRDAWQQPQQIVELLQLEAGMSVADLGAGTGYFNPHLSAAVGPEGTVYAVDVETSLVEHMAERARQEKTSNVQTILAAHDDPKLPVAVDRILLVDTYHHIDHRIEYFRRLLTSIRPDGLLVDVDWKPGKLELGPSPKHKISPEEVERELEAAGWELIEQTDLKYQYVLVFRPRAKTQDGGER